MLSFKLLLRLSAILKLDFLKSAGKSGSASPPRGMKLCNSSEEEMLKVAWKCAMYKMQRGHHSVTVDPGWKVKTYVVDGSKGKSRGWVRVMGSSTLLQE